MKNRSQLLVLVITFVLIYYLPLIVHAQTINYYGTRDLYNPFYFFNPLSPSDSTKLNSYYKVYQDPSNNITRFEYYIKGKIQYIGQYHYSKNFCIFDILKLELDVSSGNTNFVKQYTYEITLTDDMKIQSYVLFNNTITGSIIKIGFSLFSYKKNTIVINNFFGTKKIASVETTYEGPNILNRKIYNAANKITEEHEFTNNVLSKKTVYTYDKNGKLINISTYDGSGQLITQTKQ